MDTPKTPPPFRGRVARPPVSPVTPFKFDPSLTKTIPARNLLIIRGVLEKGSKKIDPTSIVTAKVAKIRTANPAVRDIPVVVLPFSTWDVSTSCYFKLGPALISLDPNTESRTNFLHLWIAALTTTGWEISWAPQQEEQHKRMWGRIPDVFAEKTDKGTDARKKNDKVNARIREVFDLAGLQTINAFKSGTGVIITFAYPAILERTISVDGKQYWVNRIRQIEIEYTFELVISGTAGIDETAMQNIHSWFASFERDGQSLLVDAQQAHREPDYLIQRTASATKLGTTTIFAHPSSSTGAWKTDSSAAITEGAKKVTNTVDALTRRIETNKHESRARDAELKQHLVGINNNVTAVTNLAVGIGRHQEELAGGFLLLQKPMHLELPSPASILTSEREEARTNITRLKIDRSIAQENLKHLLGNTPRIAPTDPYIPAPAPPAASASTTLVTPPGIAALGPCSQPDDTESNPSKCMRRTTSHDDASKATSQLEPGATEEDTVMSAPTDGGSF
ncbi:hypothetical protein B0H14DRAFT_2585653 [Mycena olivaceomarginata]|nr:hypothetical protein B0H14DRAFT_2585653 [Mycena olivaceomarginata]